KRARSCRPDIAHPNRDALYLLWFTHVLFGKPVATLSGTCARGPGTGGLEFRPATEAELLHPVVRLLGQGDRIVEPERSERRVPNQSDADRRTNMHSIIDRARHRIRHRGRGP